MVGRSTAIQSRLAAFLRLVRFGNLVMIALTQVLLRNFVLKKVFSLYGLPLALPDGTFALLVISTVLIAAAGYIINDYFDVKTDTINHPATVVIDRVIDRRVAIILHITFTAVGIALGVLAALQAGYLRLSLFHLTAAVLLWFYSTDLKKKAIVGNVAVSLLTAAVTVMPFIFEIAVMQSTEPGFLSAHRHAVLSAFKYAWIYAVFAFITTLAREIIKDMEDYEGDAATGGKTLPIVWGLNAGRVAAFFLLLITGILLMFVLYNTLRYAHVLLSVSNLYVVFALLLPTLMLAGFLLSNGSVRQMSRASLALKLIMLAGLCYSLVYYYT